MTLATIGSRYQVVIPKEERRRLGLTPFSKVSVEVKGDSIVLCPVTSKGVRGLGADLADGTDAADYVRKLRAEWDQRT